MIWEFFENLSTWLKYDIWNMNWNMTTWHFNMTENKCSSDRSFYMISVFRNVIILCLSRFRQTSIIFKILWMTVGFPSSFVLNMTEKINLFGLAESRPNALQHKQWCKHVHNFLSHIIICTYWLSGRAWHENFWLSVRTYGLREARSLRPDREPNIFPSGLTSVTQ